MLADSVDFFLNMLEVLLMLFGNVNKVVKFFIWGSKFCVLFFNIWTVL
jgi:hypothetical protein